MLYERGCFFNAHSYEPHEGRGGAVGPWMKPSSRISFGRIHTANGPRLAALLDETVSAATISAVTAEGENTCKTLC